MEKQELVSIIVPVYKVEKYLDRCVNSLVSQTYENIEIILVDDGSPDNSGNLCDEYSNRDSRIKVIHKKNGGLSSARNAGIEVSTGDYIVFVDSDDWLELNAIETLYNTLIEQEVDVVRCNYFISDGLGNDLPARLQEFNSNKKYLNNTEEFHKYVLTPFINGNMPCYVWLFMVKREFFSDKKVFEEKILFMEDGPYTLELMSKINTIYFVDVPLYHYFINQNGLTKSANNCIKNIKYMPIVMEFFEKIFEKEIFREKNYLEIRKAANSKIVMSYLYILYNTYEDEQEFIDNIKDILNDNDVYRLLDSSNLLLLNQGVKKYIENYFLKLVRKRKYKKLAFWYKIRKKLSFMF